MTSQRWGGERNRRNSIAGSFSKATGVVSAVNKMLSVRDHAWWLTSSLLLSVLSVAGCGTQSEAEQLATVSALVAKDDLSSASIQLKSLLQQHPDSAEARLLMGNVLMSLGDLGAAEIELRKALESKDTSTKAASALAKLLLKRGLYAKVISEFSDRQLPDAISNLDVLTSVASAYAFSNNDQKAQETLGRILSENPKYLPAELLQARLAAGKGNVDGALAKIQELLQREPGNIEVLLIDGYIRRHGKQDAEGAKKSFQKVLAINPKEVRAHTLLVNTFHDSGDSAALSAQIESLKKVLPNHPQTRLFESRLAFAKGEYKQSRDIARQLLQLAPDQVELLILAGAAELRLNSNLQAERDLSKAVTAAPELLTARLLLGETYVRIGQSENAQRTLAPLLGASTPHWKAMQLSAEAHLQAGNIEAADLLFRRAAKVRPDDTRLRTSVALTDLARGHQGAAFKDLEQIASSDKGTFADMALVSARMRRGEFEEARKAIDLMAQKLPDSATPDLLRAQLSLLTSDFVGARGGFGKVLDRDPGNVNALSGLELLDLQAGKYEAAQKRYEGVLEKNPSHLQALLSLASLKSRRGASEDEVVKLLIEAVRTNPDNPASHVALIQHYLAQNNSKAAVSAGQAGVAALPEAAGVLDALANAQVAAGEYRQAIGTFNKIIPLVSRSPLPQFNIARAHLLVNEPDAAILGLKRALEISPDFVDAQKLLIDVSIRANKPQEALSTAKAIQKLKPDDANGFMFEGNIAMARRQWGEAVAAYRKGTTKANPGMLPTRLHFALLASQATAEADRFTAEWNKAHPKDTVMPFYLGDLAMSQKDWGTAERQFEVVLARDANHFSALNNIAWLRLQQNKPGALPYALRAAKLAPRVASVQDTLAQVALASDQATMAVNAAAAATQLAPNAPQYRLMLSKALLKAGRKADAKRELERLRTLGAKFERNAEVTQMLNEI